MNRRGELTAEVELEGWDELGRIGILFLSDSIRPGLTRLRREKGLG